MLKALQNYCFMLFFMVPALVLAQGSVSGGCVVNFDLFGNDTLCTNSQPFNLPPVLPFGGVYSGPNVTGDFFDPNGLPPGQYTLTYTVDNETCSGSSSVVMTLIAGEDLQFVGDMEICAGTSTTITSPDGTEYTWADGSKNDSITFTPSGTFDSFASVLNANGCAITTPFTISVGQMEDFSITGDYDVCLGNSATFTIEGSSHWVWSDGSADPSISIPVLQDTLISVTVSVEFCDTIVDIPINVAPYPELSVTVDSPICRGDTVLVVASGAVTYKTSAGFFDGSFLDVPMEDTTYVVTGFNEIGCSVVATAFVLVRDSPVLVLSQPDTLCVGDSIQMTVSGAIGYIWTNLDEGIEIANGVVTEMMLIPSVTTHYQIQGVNEINCRSEVVFEIGIEYYPILTIEEITTVCFGYPAMLSATGAYTYLWNTGNENDTLQFQASQDFTAQLTGATLHGCSSDTTYDVVVHANPLAGITGVNNICAGESVSLVATGAENFLWESGEIVSEIEVFPTADSLFYVTVINSFGCSDFTVFNVNVKELPYINLSGPDSICIGHMATIVVSSDGQITWENGDGNFELNFFPSQDTLLQLTSLGANGCSNSGSFLVQVNELPVLSIDGDNDLCYGESTQLTANGAFLYEWNMGMSEPVIDVTPVVTTNYHLLGWNESGCQSETVFTVVVHPVPYAYFNFSLDTLCDLGPALTWIANPGGGILSGDGVSNNTFSPNEAQIGINHITYTVSNEFCSNSASDSLYVDDCSGVEVFSMQKLSIYPNPASSILNVQCDGCIIYGERILDSQGRVVLMNNKILTSGNDTVNISELAKGVYEFQVLTDKEGVVSSKFIVE